MPTAPPTVTMRMAMATAAAAERFPMPRLATGPSVAAAAGAATNRLQILGFPNFRVLRRPGAAYGHTSGHSCIGGCVALMRSSGAWGTLERLRAQQNTRFFSLVG
jgi:hypothetical protein